MGFIATALEQRGSRVGPALHPSRLDDPRVIFGDGLGTDHSGMHLSEREVLGWPAVLQACRLIAWSIGMTPCQLFERVEGGARKLKAAEEHPVYAILNDSPHPEYTPFEWKADIGFNAVFRGSWYGAMYNDPVNGALRSVLPLDTHRMGRYGRVRNRLRFEYEQSGGPKKVFFDEELLRVHGFRDGGIIGLALRDISATTFGKGVAMDRYGARLFKQGMGATTVVEQDKDSNFKFKDDDERQRFFDRLSDTISGEKNWHKTIGLPNGMSMKTMGISAKEAQLIEGLTFQVQDVSRLTGVPPSLLMDLSRGTFSNVEQQMLQFFKLVLGPWFVNLEQRFAKSLLSVAERRRYVIKFNPDALLRTTLKERYDAYRVGVGRPWMSPNEARDLENMEPLAEGGDEVLLPLNMADPGGDPGTSGDGGAGPAAPPKDGDSDTRGGARTLGASASGSRGTNKEEDADAPFPGCQCRYCEGTAPREETERRDDVSVRMAEGRAQNRNRNRLRRAFRGQIQREAARLVRAEIREIGKVFKKAGLSLDDVGEGARTGVPDRAAHPVVPLETRAAEDVVSGLEGWYGDGFEAAFDKTLRGVMSDYANAMAEAAAEQAQGDPASVDMGAWVEQYIAALAERVGGQHLNQIKKLVRESGADELRALVAQRLQEWDEGREDGSRMSQSEKIADWESVRAGEAAAREAWQQVGVTEIQWVTNAGACPLCEELAGQTVGIERHFVESGGEVYGNDETPTLTVDSPVGHAPLHGGCECEIAPAG